MARKWVRMGGGPTSRDGGGVAVLQAEGDERGAVAVTIRGQYLDAVEEVAYLVENAAKTSAAFEQHMAGKRISYFVSYAYRHPETGLPAFGCSSVGVDFPGLERFDQVAGIAAQISETIKASAVILSWQRCDPPLVVAPVTAGPRLVQ